MTTTTQRHAQTYRNLSVETASPARIVLMLFDGADRFLGQALRGFEEESLAVRNATITASLVKAQRIVRELRRCLDLDAGGELALTLSRLYTFVDEQLHLANFQKDRAPILLARELLGEVRSGWAGMMQGQVATLTV